MVDFLLPDWTTLSVTDTIDPTDWPNNRTFCTSLMFLDDTIDIVRGGG